MVGGIKQKLLEAGTNTIATLPKVFKASPSYNGTNKVDINDFFASLQSYGLFLTKDDSVLLIRHFDKNNEGKMNIDDFLYAVRGNPNDERQSVIDQVYYKFDKNKVGYAETTELRKVFNCQKHPRFLMGDYSEDQIFSLYLQNFNDSNKAVVTKKVSSI